MVYLGNLHIGDYFMFKGKQWQILGQLNNIAYCNCGDEKVLEFDEGNLVELCTDVIPFESSIVYQSKNA